MIHTKIVCTIGPASDSVKMLERLIRAGMNVARLNFSHGTFEEHATRINNIRQASLNAKKPVGIILDTKGPEIRIGDFNGEKITVNEGQKVVLTVEKKVGSGNKLPVTYKELAQEVVPGNEILIDDGLIGLKVIEIKDNRDIICIAKNSGEIFPHKGVNVPGVEINLPAVTEKDRADICFGIEQNVDFIAASFVRKAADILEIRKILEDKGANIDIIAKIESRSAVNNIDDILKVADGVMVARGDLGVEIPAEEVPLVQKMIIDKCNKAGKPVITATQMLDSMMRNPRPTRAEASDVANAIFDGTDAIMLSGETAAGKYPQEAVETMVRIAVKAETAIKYNAKSKGVKTSATITDAIGYASFSIADDLQAAAIITPTTSGSTAKMVSKYRPRAPIVAATPYADVQRKLCLVWGVYGVVTSHTTGTDEMIREAVSKALAEQLIKSGDLVVVTAGIPSGNPGTTNLLKVHIVGEIIAGGTGIGNMVATGKARVVLNAEDAYNQMEKGDILVTSSTEIDYIPAMEKAAAIITEEGGLTSHAAIVAINLGIPAVVGVQDATKKIPHNTVITVDGTRGQVYLGVAKVL
ncbi:MAG: pyruvate kinase [Bacillota bacterium]|jgi:pyruvate kinase